MTRTNKALQIESAWRLAQSVMFLRILGFQRTLAALNPGIRSQAPHGGHGITVDAAVLCVERAARVMGIGNCLTKSLALRGVLLRRGIETRLRIGVDLASNETPGILGAHAWLERDGKPVGPQSSEVAYNAVFPPIDPVRRSGPWPVSGGR